MVIEVEAAEAAEVHRGDEAVQLEEVGSLV